MLTFAEPANWIATSSGMMANSFICLCESNWSTPLSPISALLFSRVRAVIWAYQFTVRFLWSESGRDCVNEESQMLTSFLTVSTGWYGQRLISRTTPHTFCIPRSKLAISTLNTFSDRQLCYLLGTNHTSNLLYLQGNLRNLKGFQGKSLISFSSFIIGRPCHSIRRTTLRSACNSIR